MPRGDRLTALIAVVVVGGLAAAAAIFGVGVSSANPKLADVGAWLWSSGRNTLVHANGLSGQVDGRIDKIKGSDLKVVQDGETVLLVDQATGVVSRIEPSSMEVVQTRGFQAAQLQLVAAGRAAYAVDPRGTVQRIDPATLAAVGSPVSLPGPLGRAGIDGGGRLWVPVPANGKVVPVQGGTQGAAVTVGEAGDPLSLTIAGGLPVVVNSRKASAITIGADGRQAEFVLPSEVTAAGKGGVLTPARTESPIVPMLARDNGWLLTLDTATGTPSSTRLEGISGTAGLGVPQALGSRVYVPDNGSGRLIVWDGASKRFLPDVEVSARPGPLEVFVKDGLLWANGERGDRAVVVDSQGNKHAVAKDQGDVPGDLQTPRPEHTQRPLPTGTQRHDERQPPVTEPSVSEPPQETVDPEPSDTPRRHNEPDPEPTTETPTPTPTPTGTPSPTPSTQPSATAPRAPSSVSVESGPGKVTITFSPSVDGTVEYYTLEASPRGGKISPAQVPTDGPFQFEMTGDCGTEYTFVVVAHWKQGTLRSDRSAGARPCVAPGAPAGFTATAKNHGADLKWSAPEGAGSGTTYTLSGAAGKDGIKGTTYSVTGLKNNQKYEFTLKAKNAAGEGQATATATADLSYPTGQYKNANNDQTNTLVRPGPSASGEIGRIPKGQYITITVICQVKGASYTDTQSNQTSVVWNRIEWNGGIGYLSETLMTTPRGSFPAAPLFQCDD